MIIDAEGNAIAANHDSPIGKNFRERDYLPAVVARNPDIDKLYLGPPFKTSFGVFGMNMVRRVIGVESTAGQGSTFWFTMRLGKADNDAVPVEANESADAVSRAPTFTQDSAEKRLRTQFAETRVLLAKDEHVNQEVSHSFLEDVGRVVDVAANGAEALALAHQNRYAQILMDMQMPHLNGVETTKTIRTRMRLP